MNMFEMIKQAASMKKQMKQVQKELAKKEVEFSGGGVKVCVSCDMTVNSVQVDDELLKPENKGRLESSVTKAMNGSLDLAKKKAGEEMAKLTGGLGGLSDLLGG